MQLATSPEFDQTYRINTFSPEVIEGYTRELGGIKEDAEDLSVTLDIADASMFIPYKDAEDEAERTTLEALVSASFKPNRAFFMNGYILSTKVHVVGEPTPQEFWDNFHHEEPKQEIASTFAGRGILNSIALNIAARRQQDVKFGQASKKFNRKLLSAGAFFTTAMLGGLSQVDASNEVGRFVIAGTAFTGIAAVAIRGHGRLMNQVLPDEFDLWTIAQGNDFLLNEYERQVLTLEAVQ